MKLHIFYNIHSFYSNWQKFAHYFHIQPKILS
nr:MAG TPA: hypothetical protein [Caudoviricetes sp.]